MGGCTTHSMIPLDSESDDDMPSLESISSESHHAPNTVVQSEEHFTYLVLGRFETGEITGNLADGRGEAFRTALREFGREEVVQVPIWYEDAFVQSINGLCRYNHEYPRTAWAERSYGAQLN